MTNATFFLPETDSSTFPSAQILAAHNPRKRTRAREPPLPERKKLIPINSPSLFGWNFSQKSGNGTHPEVKEGANERNLRRKIPVRKGGEEKFQHFQPLHSGNENGVFQPAIVCV